MKTNVHPLRIFAGLLSLATCAAAQNLTTLATFSGFDGAGPQAGLAASSTTLYGTTYAGGNSNLGVVFAIDLATSNLSTVYSFNGAVYSTNQGTYIVTDGANPAGALLLSGNTLYGTTYRGGSSDSGTVFAVNTNGGTNVILHSFAGGRDGANPEAGLVLSGNTLYGTTAFAGNFGEGSIFRVNIDGSDYTNIYSFGGGTNGANPVACLIIAGNTLYGPASAGGTQGEGTVFKLDTAGNTFSNLYNFTGGNDGATPEASLLLSGNTLYGTASAGGIDGFGTVFLLTTNGSGFTSYRFDYSDGASPDAAVILAGGTLFGTASGGGSQGWGTLFEINPGGTDFTNIYTFNDAADGAIPEAPLLLVGNKLYGTTQGDTEDGSAAPYGTVFSIPAPLASASLNITTQNGKVIISWAAPSFTLQSSTNVATGYTNITATSPYTNTYSDSSRFFRLVGN